MATLTFEPLPIPLRMDDHGAIRVGDTRILVDLVIYEFQKGATPEGIVESFETLALADVYAVLSYYLRNPDALDEYLRRRDKEADAVRQMIEAAQPPRTNLRATLLARLKAAEKANAQAS